MSSLVKRLMNRMLRLLRPALPSPKFALTVVPLITMIISAAVYAGSPADVDNSMHALPAPGAGRADEEDLPLPDVPRAPQCGVTCGYCHSASSAIQEAALEAGTSADGASREHAVSWSTVGDGPEFCAACHDDAFPVRGHGLPGEQIYTEWRHSSFGSGMGYTSCQDCHMSAPTDGRNWRATEEAGKEVKTDAPGKMMGGLMAAIDATKDAFPDDRARTWPELVEVEIADGPVLMDAVNRIWELTVRVVNKAGHRIPAAYADGGSVWIGLQVLDESGTLVYESGAYDPVQDRVFNDSSFRTLEHARTTIIDASVSNAVMMYGVLTGACDSVTHPSTCEMTPDMSGNVVLFDNRIPPLGFDYEEYRAAGTRFRNYEPTTLVPYEDADRYAEGQNWDEVTYRFSVPAGLGDPVHVTAQVYRQRGTGALGVSSGTVSLRTASLEAVSGLTSIDRRATLSWGDGTPLAAPKAGSLTTSGSEGDFESPRQGTGPTPNYGDGVYPSGQESESSLARATWEGLAMSVRSEGIGGLPQTLAVYSASVSALPAAPTELAPSIVGAYTVWLTWKPVPDAEGYAVWVRYGPTEGSATWERLAVVYAPATQFVGESLDTSKTHGFSVQAFNAAGFGPQSEVAYATTPNGLLLPPERLEAAASDAWEIVLKWVDASDTEVGYLIERQDVTQGGTFVQVGEVSSPPPRNGIGEVTWTDTEVEPGRTYGYRVRGYSHTSRSGYSDVAEVTAGGPPPAVTNVQAEMIDSGGVALAWRLLLKGAAGYRVERRQDTPDGSWSRLVDDIPADVGAYTDTTVEAETTYFYRIVAYNHAGESAPSRVVRVRTRQ